MLYFIAHKSGRSLVSRPSESVREQQFTPTPLIKRNIKGETWKSCKTALKIWGCSEIKMKNLFVQRRRRQKTVFFCCFGLKVVNLWMMGFLVGTCFAPDLRPLMAFKFFFFFWKLKFFKNLILFLIKDWHLFFTMCDFSSKNIQGLPRLQANLYFFYAYNILHQILKCKLV